MRNTPRASLVAQEAVSRAHTRTPSAGWPAAFTTTPLMAPTPVVSCAAAGVPTRVSTSGGQRRRDARTEREDRDVSRASRHASADADEFLLVGVVVGKDQPPRPDDRGVTLGAASARP